LRRWTSFWRKERTQRPTSSDYPPAIRSCPAPRGRRGPSPSRGGSRNPQGAVAPCPPFPLPPLPLRFGCRPRRCRRVADPPRGCAESAGPSSAGRPPALPAVPPGGPEPPCPARSASPFSFLFLPFRFVFANKPPFSLPVRTGSVLLFLGLSKAFFLSILNERLKSHKWRLKPPEKMPLAKMSQLANQIRRICTRHQFSCSKLELVFQSWSICTFHKKYRLESHDS
jgi:hypothetical protein